MNWRLIAASVRDELAGIVYPPRCAGCGRRGFWLCAACEATAPPFQPPWCPRCGAVATRSACRCAELPLVLTRLRSALPYDGWVRQGIISLKFHDETARAEHLGRHLTPLLAEFGTIDGLVPVPLHPRRLRERGFNQALLLAGQAAAGQVAIRDDLLVRIRPTPHQVGLGAEQRRANVHGAFAVPPGLDLTGMRLVLIDDVLTTGSTLGNCAEALAIAGAASVGALTLARE